MITIIILTVIYPFWVYCVYQALKPIPTEAQFMAQLAKNRAKYEKKYKTPTPIYTLIKKHPWVKCYFRIESNAWIMPDGTQYDNRAMVTKEQFFDHVGDV